MASELCLNGCCNLEYRAKADSNIAPHQHCDATYKQVFDTRLVDRLSNSNSINGQVGVFKDTAADEIKFYISITSWPHPHQPVDCNRVIATLPLSATLDGVTSLRVKLEGEQEYPAPCFHCKSKMKGEGEGMSLDSFIDFDTEATICFGCASVHYGVVY